MITVISQAIDLIPDWLAEGHANIYLPWTMAMDARCGTKLATIG
ncbi:MAG: hypothetical protein O7G83_19205 [Proteobacteria bacterium]|nr:hypothetical protein [Pseudomonadota bacterium]